jgi:hypothetical protein
LAFGLLSKHVNWESTEMNYQQQQQLRSITDRPTVGLRVLTKQIRNLPTFNVSNASGLVLQLSTPPLPISGFIE